MDDSAALRRVLADVFADTGDIRVVAECADGAEVVEAAQRARPDVVLMDLVMPRVDGLEAARRLLDVQPEVRVVLHSALLDPTAVRAARRLGLAGYLLKGDVTDLAQHVREVAAGGTAWSPRASAVPEE
ncbi:MULTISPECIES: response regulator [unclassified Geodermatophilus]|uniref:response regulator n=1 Tax=unclassified Geodermatophilus TaxID=2637632 RepID=UPI003EF05BB0